MTKQYEKLITFIHCVYRHLKSADIKKMLKSFNLIKDALESIGKKSSSNYKIGFVANPKYNYNDGGDDDDDNKDSDVLSLKKLDKSYASVMEVLAMIETSVVNREQDYFTYDSKNITAENIESIAKACQQSGFGDLKQGKTVVDIKVRNALESRNIVITQSGQSLLDQLESEITKRLFKSDSKGVAGAPSLTSARPDSKGAAGAPSLTSSKVITLVLNKLNIYQKGGFFNLHKDTPGPDTIGTVVIELPIDYEGSEFEFHSNTSSKAQVIKVKPRNRYDYNKYRIFCFFGDVPHRITPVTNGTRVTVSFYIKKFIAGAASAAVSAAASAAGNAGVVSTPAAVMVTPAKRSSGVTHDLNLRFEEHVFSGRLTNTQVKNNLTLFVESCLDYVSSNGSLGLFMSRQYSFDELKNQSYKGFDVTLINKFNELILNSSDPKLSVVPSGSEGSRRPSKPEGRRKPSKAVAAEKKGQFKIDFVPIVIRHEEQHGEGYDTIAEQDVYRFTDTDIHELAAATAATRTGNAARTGRDASASARATASASATTGTSGASLYKDVPFLEGSFETSVLKEHHQEGADYTGNESMPDELENYYYTAGLVIYRT